MLLFLNQLVLTIFIFIKIFRNVLYYNLAICNLQIYNLQFANIQFANMAKIVMGYMKEV